MRIVLLSLMLLFLSPLSADHYTISTGPKSNIYIEFLSGVIPGVYHAIGMEVVVDYTSLEKSLVLVNSGISDAELFRAAIVLEKYPNLLRIDEPLFTIETTAFYYRDLTVTDWESLRGYRVSFVRGIKSYENGLSGFTHVIPSDTLETAFMLLQKGRVDCVITGKLNGLNMVKQMGLEEDLKVSDSIESFPVYHYINKKNKEIKSSIESEIKKLDIEYHMELFLK